MKILDCSDVKTTITSLCKLLNATEKHLEGFIKQNTYRVVEDRGMTTYNDLKIEDVTTYFDVKKEEILPDRVLMFHLTSAANPKTYTQNGLLNLHTVVTKGLMDNFFTECNLKIVYKEGEMPLVQFNNTTVEYSMLDHRFKEDQCINGFLIKEGAEYNSHVKHLRDCPEFIIDMGKLPGIPNLKEIWIRKAVPLKLTLEVNFKDINEWDVYNYILEPLRYLILKQTASWSLGDNFMVFLKENINVPPEKVVKIEELKEI
ncbi:hypothetical protein P4679_24480 [Priestia megaterium]|uniref:hypothetical protein n=1 Tax=Priestia megaterium TaxID=1404 RepID=UPI002E20C384|nr:hypothetical protein [Priestia megaterium]